MKKMLTRSVLVILFLSQMESAHAAEFEPLGKAAAAALGTTKAFRKTVNVDKRDVTLFYSKDASGQPEKYAFVEKGIYEPSCTHTWVVGVDAKTNKVSEVRVVEMSCPHAFPTKAASFLDQFKGKGPADVAKLSSQISTIAKATGSANLTTDAVKRSITAASQMKGKL
ncbi:MAG: FMN-binding protein [Methylotenera sp.]|nr:FMN-binding protein [Oligoflexia bacterium]